MIYVQIFIKNLGSNTVPINTVSKHLLLCTNLQ